MSEHDWQADPDWPKVITEAKWKPGLPPPIEALQTGFRPEHGWEVTYATWFERGEGGLRSISIARVTHPDRGTVTFFPQKPKHATGEPVDGAPVDPGRSC
jgi:hypothetical protein